MSRGKHRNNTQGKYASLEIIAYSYKLVISHIPLLPFSWRRRIYQWYVEGLSIRALRMYSDNIVEAMCFNKRESRRYKNTERELSNILESIPRLRKSSDILRVNIRSKRQKYNLKV